MGQRLRYSAQLISALERFVKRGGGMPVPVAHDNIFDIATVQNQLTRTARPTGLREAISQTLQLIS